MQNHALVFLFLFMVLLVALPPAFARFLAKPSGPAGEQKSADTGASVASKNKKVH
jgi:hypothetical protein